MNNQLPSKSDSDLIAMTLVGRKDAFGDLVRRYQDRLYNAMVQMLRSEVEAEDTVQEAFILALTKLHTFKGGSQFYTWLYRIAFNNAVSRLRRRKPSVSLDGQIPGHQLQIPDDVPMPYDGMIERERAGQLMRALDRMSEEHRNILVMREMDGMDYSAMSEVLDLPIGTVRSRLHRARLQLKELLEAMMAE